MRPEQRNPIVELSADAYRKCILRVALGMTSIEEMTPRQAMRQTINYAIASAKYAEAKRALDHAMANASFS